MSLATSDDLLAQLAGGFPRVVELSLRPDYYNLLAALGNPQQHLPPVLHVAGTNGKGSTCAFIHAILEAAGKRVHVYTSPHLVRFHERIRLAGSLIDEARLVALLQRVASLITPGTISQFEATTAAAFAAFAETPADYLVLETGLGGRFDATNVVAQPLASLISRISYDHREFLGGTIEKIAGEKAGIIKPGTPCFIGQQCEAALSAVFAAEAKKQQAPLYTFGQDWRIEAQAGGAWQYHDPRGTIVLPPPSLPGAHQLANASHAIAALRWVLPDIADAAIQHGVVQAVWPARLQRLQQGALAQRLPTEWELWLDGGHNDSAGEVLAEQAAAWRQASKPLPLIVIYGMLNSKVPEEFLRPLAPHITQLYAVTIPDTPNSLPAAVACDAAQRCAIPAQTAADVSAALKAIQAQQKTPARILICGSLYLAGHVLLANSVA